jgi:hypothetical protein
MHINSKVVKVRTGSAKSKLKVQQQNKKLDQSGYP